MTIRTEIDPQPAILTHHCGECGYVWKVREFQRRDGSYPEPKCPMCAATNGPTTSTEKQEK